MRPATISNAWRWTSLVLGVLLPAGIWMIATRHMWRPAPDEELRTASWMLRGTWILAFAEIGCLAWWLLPLQRSARAERTFSWILATGAVFAGAWSLLAVFILVATIGMGEGSPGLVIPAVLWLCTPFACIWIYGVNARHARDRARAIWDAG